MTTETKKEHYYYFYGNVALGYGPSMDPHRCGDASEPCMTIVYEREVSDWAIVNYDQRGELPPK